MPTTKQNTKSTKTQQTQEQQSVVPEEAGQYINQISSVGDGW